MRRLPPASHAHAMLLIRGVCTSNNLHDEIVQSRGKSMEDVQPKQKRAGISTAVECRVEKGYLWKLHAGSKGQQGCAH